MLITYLHLAPRMNMSRALPLCPHHYARHGLLSGDFYLCLFQGLFQHLYIESHSVHICCVLNWMPIPYSTTDISYLVYYLWFASLESFIALLLYYSGHLGSYVYVASLGWRLLKQCDTSSFHETWTHKDEDDKYLRNVWKHSSKHTASHPRRPESY